MAVVVELSIPVAAFDLGRVTRGAADVHLELERVVPTGESVMPFFWARGGDDALAELERVVGDASIVERVTAIARVDDRALYHVTWSGRVSSLTEVFVNEEATILEAHGDDPWQFRLRFPDHEHLSAFHDDCRAAGIEFHVDRVYDPSTRSEAGAAFGLTEPQEAALVAAVDGGSFEVPRRVTLGEIAAELDISQQAASERVRRGANAVLRGALAREGV
jgi:predicted DNA binding protein